MKLAIIFPFAPVPALRMTQGQVRLLKAHDHKLTKAQQNVKYRVKRCIDNKTQLAWYAKGHKFTMPENGSKIVFWIETKVKSRWGTGHKQVPDVDNLAKQVMDALCSSDSHIYDVAISKFWCEPGKGRVEIWA